MLKAVVTQASSAIPVMPLYLSLLFKVMKAQGTHEGCIEQIDLLFRESLYGPKPRIDDEGRWRVDYKELEPAVQQQVARLWQQVTSENVISLADFAAYKTGFLQLFGFEVPGVDYEADFHAMIDRLSNEGLTAFYGEQRKVISKTTTYADIASEADQ